MTMTSAATFATFWEESVRARADQPFLCFEAIPAVVSDHADDPRHDSMGIVTAGCPVDIQDADGRSVGDDEVRKFLLTEAAAADDGLPPPTNPGTRPTPTTQELTS